MNEPVLVSTAAGDDRRRLKVLLALAVVLAVLALAVPRLLGGGADPAAPFPASTPATTAPPATVPAAPHAVSTRNPFVPLR